MKWSERKSAGECGWRSMWTLRQTLLLALAALEPTPGEGLMIGAGETAQGLKSSLTACQSPSLSLIGLKEAPKLLYVQRAV